MSRIFSWLNWDSAQTCPCQSKASLVSHESQAANAGFNRDKDNLNCALWTPDRQQRTLPSWYGPVISDLYSHLSLIIPLHHWTCLQWMWCTWYMSLEAKWDWISQATGGIALLEQKLIYFWSSGRGLCSLSNVECSSACHWEQDSLPDMPPPSSDGMEYHTPLINHYWREEC